MTTLNEPCAVVFVGRNNSEKRSDTFPRIAQNLREQGHSVYCFESDRTAASLRINDKIKRRWPKLATSTDRHHPLYRRVLRVLVKSLLVIADRHRCAFLTAAIISRPVAAARELDRFIEGLPRARVYIITHSAGGISATMISASPKIGGICCFGYPFKHPDRPIERYRIRHLSEVAKPLWIIQGTSDPYGSNPRFIAALLPRAAQVVLLDCDHDYNDLGDREFGKAWLAVQGLIGTPPSVPAL